MPPTADKDEERVMALSDRKPVEEIRMFAHAWHWITRSTEPPTPYWFCAKCGARVDGEARPTSAGCQIEK